MSLVGLAQAVAALPELGSLADSLARGEAVPPLGLMRAARPYLAAALRLRLAKPLIYLASSVDASRTMTDALRALGQADDAAESVRRFAEPNTSFYDAVPPVADVVAQRSVALAELRPPASTVIVSGPRALMHPTLSPRAFATLARVLKRDQEVTLEAMVAHWVSIGYEPASVVERIGAFSRRGGIIDVWSPAHALPARIELFGDQIDSLRFFDPSSQRSGAEVERVTVAPLESALADKRAMLVEFLGDDGVLLIDDEDELRAAWAELEEKAERERAIADAHPDAKPYLTWQDLERARQTTRTLVLGSGLTSSGRHALAEHFRPAQHFAGQLSPLLNALHAATSKPDAAVVVVSRQAARLAELWSDKHTPLVAQTALDAPPPVGLTFVTGALPGGFETKDEVGRTNAERAHSSFVPHPSSFIPHPSSFIPHPSSFILHTSALTLFTDAEIFGYVRPESSSYARARKAAPERAFSDWQSGDAVVHEDYGIGLYRGTTKLTVKGDGGDVEREYLLLEFDEADKLYVPMHQLDRISRYIGSEDLPPRLSKLGTQEWALAKTRARGNAAEMAREMLELYAQRELAEGHAFGTDTPWQAELEASFPYVETDDQLSAIVEVKRDMEEPQPMDRLVVGDVGYGKTEVALRAAFKAVQDGLQVAVLVPTTILAQQHWNTFSKRLASYPMKVEMLSRFRSPAEKREVLVGMRDGTVDIVIGTHGLVSERAQFKQLGLLIIDEEHRFGITQKEKLKKLRANVDVITLSATPIPRTLYLGLSGVRDISRIETPPAERLPIITHVGAFDEGVAQQAILRELGRDGQVFFVHNRISTIYLLEEKLKRLLPEARVAVAHGQMDERGLSRIMSDFADGKTDVLLSTNIIESGLDIPNANTIIIDRADHFGLAELYQLRGRVGRSTTQAYAYFFYDRRGRMTQDARERLETMREAAGMGAGYMIAMRDLELRGAGDMLGPKQSGHVANIGLDLYTRLLAHQVSVIRALRDGQAPPPAEPKAVTIDLPFATSLPERYIGDTDLRMQLYRRMASLDDDEKIRAFEEELEDRFGPLPQPTQNLMFQMRLKIAATALGASAITTDGNRFTVRADAIEHMNPKRLELLLGEGALIGRKQVSFVRSGTPAEWKARLMKVVAELARLAELTRGA